MRIGPVPAPSGRMLLEIVVTGHPRVQGNHIPAKRSDGTLFLREKNSVALDEWRAAVVQAAKIARMNAGYPATFSFPVRTLYVFAIHWAKNTNYTEPTARLHGDTEKLERAVNDCMTTAKVWEDDGLVVDHRAIKAFTGTPRACGQNKPGVIIRIWEAGHQSTQLEIGDGIWQ
jgi:Holliday junction resolvase RusA-like endonuclease